MNTQILATPRWLEQPANKGLLLGLLGVTIFALTLPMTRLAVGTVDAPQMSGVFVALGRAVVAAPTPVAKPGNNQEMLEKLKILSHQFLRKMKT